MNRSADCYRTCEGPDVFWNETDERGRVYTVYGVLVQFRGQKIGALHRFSDFRSLHHRLKRYFPALKFPLPPFPLFGRLRADVVETRALGLAAYLSSILAALGDEGHFPPPLSAFFHLPFRLTEARRPHAARPLAELQP